MDFEPGCALTDAATIRDFGVLPTRRPQEEACVLGIVGSAPEIDLKHPGERRVPEIFIDA